MAITYKELILQDYVRDIIFSKNDGKTISIDSEGNVYERTTGTLLYTYNLQFAPLTQKQLVDLEVFLDNKANTHIKFTFEAYNLINIHGRQGKHNFSGIRTISGKTGLWDNIFIQILSDEGPTYK